MKGLMEVENTGGNGGRGEGRDRMKGGQQHRRRKQSSDNRKRKR